MGKYRWGSILLLAVLVVGCAGAAPESRPASGPAAAAGSATALPASSAAATAAPATPAAPSTPVALRIALNTPGAAVGPLWIAKEEGFFTKHGVEADLVQVPGAERIVAAMLAGETPVAVIAAPALINAVLGGADLVLLGSYTNDVRFQLFGRPEVASVRDLRGKQIGVTGRGGIIRRATELILTQNGLDPERDVTLIAMGSVTETLAALLGGAIDASMQGPPNSFRAEDEGMRLLAETADYHYRTVQQGIATRRSWIAEHEAVLRGVLQAVAEAIAFAERNPARTQQIIGQYSQTDDARLLERTYAAVLPAWDKTLRAPPEVLRMDLDAVAEDQPVARDARPEQFLDSRFVDELERSGFFTRLGQ
ncbi:MAG TPA: ABC transporter substrate-binding protein [Chloroflexota bacterium]|nr:ABC transporter substrate-binding protein [Chloroflexota bacterium]